MPAFAPVSEQVYAGQVSGSGSVTMAGPSTLTLTGSNTYSGGTTINGGTLQLGDGATANGHLAGNIVNNAALAFAPVSGLVYAGQVSGCGSLLMSGPGTLTLSGSNTFAGPTTAAGGVLAAGAANTLSPNSAINVSGGTLDVTAAAQTVSVLTLSAAATLNLQQGKLLSSTGAAGLGGTLNLSGVAGGGPLMSYGSESGSFKSVSGLPGGDSLIYGTTQLYVGTTNQWAAAVSGNWSSAGNWIGGVPNLPGATAVINQPTGSPLSVTLDLPVTVGGLVLGNSASAVTGYTISGGNAAQLQ